MPKIAVIGDVMLDTYHHLDAVRPAPEGGLIYRIDHTDYRPGAAANIADCLETLGWEVTLFAHSGTDHASKILQSWALACGIYTQWNPLRGHQKTRENTRYYNQNKCLLRADMPNPDPLEWPDFSLERLLPMDAVVLYDKGSLHQFAQTLIDFCNKHGIKTYIDPSRTHTTYPSAYLFKANRSEYDNINTMKLDGKDLKQSQQWTHLIVTNEQDPIQYWDEFHNYHEIAIEPCDLAHDPVGAGDAFLSGLITAEWENIPLKEAIEVAKRSGSRALAHRGTYAPTRSELMLPQAIRSESSEL